MANRNDVTVDGGQLTVRPRGLDALWCFRSRVVVPLGAVTSVRLAEKRTVRRGLRTFGTDIGFKICGTFQSKGAVNFWNYRSPGAVLVIELESGQRFTNLYLSVDAPQVVRDRILRAARLADPSR